MNEISAFNVGDKIRMKSDDKVFGLKNSADDEFVSFQSIFSQIKDLRQDKGRSRDHGTSNFYYRFEIV